MQTNAKVFYLDSSALVKLFKEEAETTALRQFLRDGLHLVSSALARVEVGRVARAYGAAAAERAHAVLESMTLMHLDDELLDAAVEIDGSVLRSLDAIHLASASALGASLSAIVTYDQRMGAAARQLGLTVVAPGAPSTPWPSGSPR